jgi:hypothetical protein
MSSSSRDHSFSNSDWSSANDHEKMLFDEMEQKVVMVFFNVLSMISIMKTIMTMKMKDQEIC